MLMQKVESALGGDEPKCGIQPSPIPIVDNPTALSSHTRGWQHRPTESRFHLPHLPAIRHRPPGRRLYCRTPSPRTQPRPHRRISPPPYSSNGVRSHRHYCTL